MDADIWGGNLNVEKFLALMCEIEIYYLEFIAHTLKRKSELIGP